MKLEQFLEFADGSAELLAFSCQELRKTRQLRLVRTTHTIKYMHVAYPFVLASAHGAVCSCACHSRTFVRLQVLEQARYRERAPALSELQGKTGVECTLRPQSRGSPPHYLNMRVPCSAENKDLIPSIRSVRVSEHEDSAVKAAEVSTPVQPTLKPRAEGPKKQSSKVIQLEAERAPELEGTAPNSSTSLNRGLSRIPSTSSVCALEHACQRPLLCALPSASRQAGRHACSSGAPLWLPLTGAHHSLPLRRGLDARWHQH
jgi:hypothetical protein